MEFSTQERAERHHLAAAVANLELFEDGGVGAEKGIRLHLNLPRSPKLVELVNVQPAHEKSCNVARTSCRRHLEGLHLDPVDVNEEFGRRRKTE